MDGQILSSHPFPSPTPSVRMHRVTYRSQGLKVKGLLAVPSGGSDGRGLLYLRGGIKHVGRVRPSRIGQIAREGFVVFAPFYRGNEGGEGEEDFGWQDRYDAYSGLVLLKQYPGMDGKKLHVFGFSRGGLMALWTAISFPDLASVAVWGGVTDLKLLYVEREDLRRMLKRVVGGSPWKDPAPYQKRTPLGHIRELASPLLIIHGKGDRNVSFEHACRLEREARSAGKPVTAWYFEEYGHQFPPLVQLDVTRCMTRWMKERELEAFRR